MIENEKEKYESLLNITEMLIKRHQREKRKNGGDFNIFNILDKKSAELSHEKFIFDLINPKGSHSQDTKFLKGLRFVKRIFFSSLTIHACTTI